jgi:hypothetical protein
MLAGVDMHAGMCGRQAKAVEGHMHSCVLSVWLVSMPYRVKLRTEGGRSCRIERLT